MDRDERGAAGGVEGDGGPWKPKVYEMRPEATLAALLTPT
jgi:hypothetical protein